MERQTNGTNGTNGTHHSTMNGNEHDHGVNGINSSSGDNNGQAQFPIAIVGMSCKFGGEADTPHKLWDLVSQGKTCWSPIPHSRFDAASWYNANREARGRVSSVQIPPVQIINII